MNEEDKNGIDLMLILIRIGFISIILIPFLIIVATVYFLTK